MGVPRVQVLAQLRRWFLAQARQLLAVCSNPVRPPTVSPNTPDTRHHSLPPRQTRCFPLQLRHTSRQITPLHHRHDRSLTTHTPIHHSRPILHIRQFLSKAVLSRNSPPLCFDEPHHCRIPITPWKHLSSNHPLRHPLIRDNIVRLSHLRTPV
jgi:hypothetical protein